MHACSPNSRLGGLSEAATARDGLDAADEDLSAYELARLERIRDNVPHCWQLSILGSTF
jgi:hypothetical protein